MPEESLPSVQEISLENFALSGPESVKEHIAKKRESSRTIISVIILACLLAIILCSFITLWVMHDLSADSLKMVLELTVAPVIGIVGAVTGFYFGEKSSS